MQNGEKIPKKIILISPTLKNRNILTFDNEYKIYFDENKQSLPLHLSDNLQNLNDEIEIIEEETIDIETINAYKLIEAPYMADCLRGNQFNIFTDLLKQSELEIVEKINKLVDKVKQLDREIKGLKEKEDE